MKKFGFSLLFVFLYNAASAQIPDNAPWCPPGAVWLYSEFAASELRYLQYSYIKDTMVLGKTAKQLKVSRIRFLGPNDEVRNTEDVGFEYYYNTNDSVYFLDNGSFRFIYEFTPQVGDKWITGSTHFSCPSAGYPIQDTITVDSIKQFPLGGKTFDFIINNSYSRSYILGNVIKNIGAQAAPYPFVNRGKCPLAPYVFQGLVCYFDNIRGYVTLPNAPPNCHGVITSVPVLNVEKTPLSIYPNPVSSVLNIKVSSSSNMIFAVFDVGGREILSGKLIKPQVDVSMLRPGIYFIRFTIGKRQYSATKFIKL